MPLDARARPGRRLVLGGAAGSLVAGLSGCGVTLEDGAPALPFLEGRTAVPDEALLAGLTRECAELAQLAGRTPEAPAPALVAVHRRQRQVLRSALRADGVPAAVLDPSPMPVPTTTGGLPRTLLGDAESASAARASRFAGVAGPLRTPVAALHAQRFAATVLLTGSPPPLAAVTLAGPDVDAVAAAVDGAVYLLQVTQARSRSAVRRRAVTSLAALRTLRDEVAAGGEVPPPAAGHPLPFPVASPADAARLAEAALTALRADLGAHVDGLVTTHDADGSTAVARWLGTAEVEAHRWGVPLAPFPGLS